VLVLAVFAGGCLGGGLRYAVQATWPTPPDGFPAPVLTVNLVGCFLLAVLVAVLRTTARPAPWVRPLLGTGVCGALTTFSFVVVAAVQLMAHGRWTTATGYLVATFAGGLLAARAGLATGRALPAGSRPA